MAVTVIEMVGMVGAGKTTLASALSDDLERRGFRVFGVETAIAEVMGRSLVGSVTRRLLPSAGSQRRALRAGYEFVLQPWNVVRFAARHPGLAWSGTRAAWHAPLPLWHRRRILGLFLFLGAALRYFPPRLRSDEILLLEEGLVHRAVNLFAWSSGDIDRTAVARYLAMLPRTDLVILVAAPLSVCVERASSRGLPRRLKDRDDETVTRFLRNAAEIVDGIPGFLRDSRRPSIIVDNGGVAPAAAVASVQEAIDAHLPAAAPPVRHDAAGGVPGSDPKPVPHGSPPSTPCFQGGRGLRRPQRGTAGSRRQPPRISPELVEGVLAGFALRAVGPVEPVSATSRADNVVVPTSSGKKLLKRYKDSVTEPAIAHEHSILEHLASLDFPSPRLAVAADGTTACSLAGGWYALFDYYPGYFHYNEYLWAPRTRQELVGLSARALASLHVALDDFTPAGANPDGFVSREGGRFRDIEWYLHGLERARLYRGAGGADTATFRGMLDEHAERLETELRTLHAVLASAALPRQVIHGDYGPYNLLFRRGERIVILDFELARMDWRLTDVAKALQQFGVNRFGLHLPHIARFVTEYARQRTLSQEEWRLLPSVWLFLTLRRVAVCWHRFAESENKRWLAEAHRKLQLAKMIRASADELATLDDVGGQAGQAGIGGTG